MQKCLTHAVGVREACAEGRGPEEEAQDTEEDQVEDVPEVRCDPVPLPVLIVVVRDCEIHLIGNPGHTDPYHHGQAVCEIPASKEAVSVR